MPDDLDDLLRRSMKSLDDQVPSGYFEALPEQTLARLETSMQATGTGTTQRAGGASVPPQPEPAKEENSGLHDIRNLAQSTKQRLSSRKSGSSPALDDDVLASTSAGWKAVALPAPAKMVSLPALDELPSKAEVLAKEKAAKAAAVEAPAAASAGVATPAAPIPFRRPAAKSRARTFALAGIGLAAAAGVAIFFAARPKGEDAATKAAAQTETTRPAAVPATGAANGLVAKNTVEPVQAPEPPPPPAPEAAAAPADTTTPATGDVARNDEGEKHGDKGGGTRGGHVIAGKKLGLHKGDQESHDKDVVAQGSGSGSSGDKQQDNKKKQENEPSFDALLKEAGVDQNQQKVQKPHLDKKELTADDFKHGMDAISARAQACYKGTQGTANVKIVVAPSGKVSKVVVTGMFAGKAEAQCVMNAVRGATFPAWDGGPQSFVYPFLLSE